MKDRYDVSDLPEAQFEPGSGGRVLRNLLGVTSKREMEALETREYIRTIQDSPTAYGPEHRFTPADLCTIHKHWLGDLYSWAGQYRRVNLSKGDFSFAQARQVPHLMEEFGRTILGAQTPCRASSHTEAAHAIALVHAEFILIHPFREGNGRLGRILSTLMALQAGLPPLNFGGIHGVQRQFYFSAVRAALGKDYGPMKRVFELVIARTLRKANRAKR